MATTMSNEVRERWGSEGNASQAHKYFSYMTMTHTILPPMGQLVHTPTELACWGTPPLWAATQARPWNGSRTQGVKTPSSGMFFSFFSFH